MMIDQKFLGAEKMDAMEKRRGKNGDYSSLFATLFPYAGTVSASLSITPRQWENTE